MDYRDIIRLKAFFSALKDSGFKQNLNQIPSFTTIDGQRTPVDKTACLELLRKFPQFQGDKFKDDNTIIKYLSDPRNRGYILGNFTPQQRVELEKLLEAKFVAEEVWQPTEQEQPVAGEQPVTGETAPTMVGGTHLPSETPRIQTGRFRPPASAINVAKNLGSSASIFTNTTSRRVAGGLGEMAKGIGRAIVGPGLTGAYNLGARAAIGGINAFSRLSNQVGGGGFSGRGFFGKNTGRKFLLLVLGSFLFFGVILASISGGPTPGGGTSPGSATTTDISSCKFTRSDLGDPTPFKSSTLLGYIQEASQKANIPPVVLAAFIRVESPSSSNMSDGQIVNYSANCERSSTGALGIMQIQPPGTTSARGDPASCDDCIDAGAKLVGKTVSTMTRQDYCDPRTNIIVGAGWILKKMSKLGYGDGTKWDPAWTNDRKAIEALVNTYYGCLRYGGERDCTGNYNYADDVATSIQNCQVTTPGTVPALPPGADYAAEISKNFRINFIRGKFTENHLRWAWGILSQAKTITPNFFNLIGTVTVDTRLQIGERVGNTIFFSTDPKSFFSSADELGFKVLLIHELGHVIRGDPGLTQQRYDQLLQQAINQDGGYLTGYGQNACTGTLAVDEDFAETVAYYINKGTPERNLACGQKSFDGLNPLYSGRYPNHMSFIRSILETSPQ